MVDFAPAWWAGAAGVGTTAVAGGDRPAHPVRDGAGLAPDIQWLPDPVQHDGDDSGVAAEPAQLGGVGVPP